ncbi:MAG: cell wall-binding repeat-containing protein [Peptostreptococcus sp.]|uniref:cell wall-binding repeat-containing protein n=1 Tax=Peptostreptococcus sp. TaxID=1262 RepID=UPI002FC63686
MKKLFKKTLIIATAAALLVPFGGSHASADQVNVKNISGVDRFSTAVSISQSGWPNGSKNIMLVNSDAVADSLSVAPLASKMKAPVLLTNNGFLNNATSKEIKRLSAQKVTIIGGYGSVSSNVENSLKSQGYEVERIAGSTRVETSVKIAEKLKDLDNKKFENAFIVNGMTGLADAAGVGSVAAKNNSPIIFVNKYDSESVRSNLNGLGIDSVFLIGGIASLPNPYDSIATHVERISGKDRQETNYNMINRFYKNYDTVYIADDGSKNPTKLIDSVLINAGIIASNNNGEDITDNTSKPIDNKDKDKDKDKEPTTKVDPNKDDSIIGTTTVDDAEGDQTIGTTTIDSNVKKGSSQQEDISGETVETIDSDNKASAENNIKSAPVSTSNSNLKEGPVMLVSEKRGLGYNQMRALNNDNNRVKEITQVSGGANFTNTINNITDFINAKGDPKADQAFNKILGYEGVTIAYNVSGNTKSIDGNNILQMLNCNMKNDFNIQFDKNLVKNFASSIDTSGVTTSGGQDYAYRRNGNIIIGKGGSTSYVDVNYETNRIMELLSTGKSYSGLTPKYIKTTSTIPNNATPLGNKYVQIDIKSQHMWLWKNGKAIVSTPIVTGNPNKGWATPPGIFTIKNKMKNVVLRGPGYASPVTYWIPFNGSIGIHDASWQPVYGGNRYQYAGSRGCINTPYNNATLIYNNVAVGTPVIVQSNASIK